MRAVFAPEPGGPEALQILDVEVPEPAAGEVLLKVAAAGVNRADILQRQGFYDPPAGATKVLGLEVSGHIAAHGANVDAPEVGSPVVALLTGGGYAEYVAVPAGQVAAVPDGLDLTAAAGVMETAATVWSNLVMLAGLKAGDRLLVHGGGSGIGTTAIGFAKALGAEVHVTVGSDRKADFCRELGADFVINYRTEDFVEKMRAAGGADVILDIIGAKYLDQNVKALGTGGHLVVIGLQGGIRAELNLAALLAKRASVSATSLRARPVEEKSQIVSEMTGSVWDWIEAGKWQPIVDSTFALDDVADAHRHLESSEHIGKIVLTI